MQENQYGTEKDGSSNETYCCYCYKDGAFTSECTMEEMADFCAPIEVKDGRAKTVRCDEGTVLLPHPSPLEQKTQSSLIGRAAFLNFQN